MLYEAHIIIDIRRNLDIRPNTYIRSKIDIRRNPSENETLQTSYSHNIDFH